MICYVLDACALIALLEDEEGADVVSNVINLANRGQATVVMHNANLLEVYYAAYRTQGKKQADLMLNKIMKLPIIINNEITNEIFAEAGRLKATYKVSFADTFALAQAIVSDGALLTCDHHEFGEIEGKENINFKWIRV